MVTEATATATETMSSTTLAVHLNALLSSKTEQYVDWPVRSPILNGKCCLEEHETCFSLKGFVIALERSFGLRGRSWVSDQQPASLSGI
jgi:hypothetical protein